ncbi:MAG: hypothetical protein GC165_08410 [Armatimonadetes bacterium]|nr:hypothetical protein [Armatimonadota bacterium]MBS1728849.1 hypothetical protein [Armatimonadota bacterium]
MGEVERVNASYGASFGSYGRRINEAAHRQPKKDDHHQEHHPKDDALELHEDGTEEAKPRVHQIQPESDEHLDLSA